VARLDHKTCSTIAGRERWTNQPSAIRGSPLAEAELAERPDRLLVSQECAGPHALSHHQSAKAMAVIEMEIVSEVAISFVHSQYDTNTIPVGPMPRCTRGPKSG
jgi:hypothetical protein